MSTTLEETVTLDRLTDQALAMTPHDQALLLARLHDNLTSAGRDADYEAAWAVEIERRLREIENGEVELIDHEDVMREARESLARR